MDYYYYFENEKFGPFVLDDLKDMKLPGDMPIWHEGLAGWQEASTIPELNGFLLSDEPVITKPTAIKPKRSLLMKTVRFLLISFLLLMAIGLVGSSLEKEDPGTMPFILAVIFTGIAVFIFFKKPKNQMGSAISNSAEVDGMLYAQQMNAMQQADAIESDDNDYGDDFD